MEYEIKPPSKFSFGFFELWEHRELLYFYTWRDIKVKYKQTALGVLWVLLQPLVFMFLFTFLLNSKFSADLPDGLPYPVFVLTGLLCWNTFASAVNNAGNSMVTNAPIIKKIYFPRLIIPIASIAGAFIDLAVGCILYVVALLYYKPVIHPALLMLVPVAVFLIFISSFGIGLFIAALNIKYRDFRYLLPFFVQTLMFVSPVLYPFTSFNTSSKLLFSINPMYAPLELFRLHLTGGAPELLPILISITSSTIFLTIGIFVFRKTERYFADVV